MLGRMNRETGSEQAKYGRILMRPNYGEAKEWGDGIREMEFFGKIGREGDKRMQSMVDILQAFT
jgi:hypothetical protein